MSGSEQPLGQEVLARDDAPSEAKRTCMEHPAELHDQRSVTNKGRNCAPEMMKTSDWSSAQLLIDFKLKRLPCRL
jgi:hypothetical protein